MMAYPTNFDDHEDISLCAPAIALQRHYQAEGETVMSPLSTAPAP